jgi:hypothetical protein
MVPGMSYADIRVEISLRDRFRLHEETVTFKTASMDTYILSRATESESVSRKVQSPEVAPLVERLLRLSMTPAKKSRRCKQRVTITSELATRVYCRGELRQNYELRSALSALEHVAPAAKKRR